MCVHIRAFVCACVRATHGTLPSPRQCARDAPASLCAAQRCVQPCAMQPSMGNAGSFLAMPGSGGPPSQLSQHEAGDAARGRAALALLLLLACRLAVLWQLLQQPARDGALRAGHDAVHGARATWVTPRETAPRCAQPHALPRPTPAGNATDSPATAGPPPPPRPTCRQPTPSTRRKNESPHATAAAAPRLAAPRP